MNAEGAVEATARPLEGLSMILRKVNETIRELAGKRGGTDSWEFFCECEDPSCMQLVPLSLSDFDIRLNASPPIAILVCGHQAPAAVEPSKNSPTVDSS